jgi:hypothetical protein
MGIALLVFFFSHLLLLAILASLALFDCYMLHGRVKKGL